MINWLTLMIMNLISGLIIIMFVLVGVAFLTLLERKILSYIQYRKGPNKVGVMGVFQPFSDAIKLFCKEDVFIFKSNYIIFYLCPLFMLMLMLMCWMLLPVVTNLYFMNYSVLVMIVLMSMGGYSVLLMAWASNSLYSLMGAIRFVAQAISYEVSFILVVYCLMILSEGYSLWDLMSCQDFFWNGFLLLPVFFVFFLSSLAELNRSPFDLVEGESELVSGYNIEYFSIGFAFIFMGEYGMIIFFCYVILLMFTNLILYKSFMFFLSLMMIMVVLMRGILPRMRYDELMYLCWKIVLPLILNYLLFIFGMKFFIGFKF